MPSQMPPTRSISVELSWTMIMSRPGAMPSLTTPSTVPVKVSGWVLPAEPSGPAEPSTVRPVTGWPEVSEVSGYGAGQEKWSRTGPAPCRPRSR